MRLPPTPVLLLGLLSACNAPTARFQVRESVEQLQVTHADPGTALSLYDPSGKQVQSGVADKQGSLVFRQVPPGSGYLVIADKEVPAEYVGHLTVMSVAGSQPAPDFYAGQKLSPGSGYIRTRDGTQLSIYVTMPGPPENGPYPTVVNYSGYSPSKPGDKYPQYSFLCDTFPTLCDAPDDPSALLASLFGYATVGVNIRGTGCSGGAYDFFDTLQVLDGYDVIETVAAQSWVLNNKVGMTGISYPGFSQFFVAQTRPPSLAAISPLSVIGNSFQTLAPGGILNTGFAVAWAQDVQDKADPYGQGWEQARVDAGDLTCKENQLLHSQKVDIVQEVHDNPYYRADLGDPINPVKFVQKIEVPVFLASAWQDEQTGPFFTPLLDQFTSTKVAHFTVYNGVHVDAFAPAILVEWKNFLDLYVARRIPSIDPKIRQLAPLLFQQVFNAPLTMPAERFTQAKSYEEARAMFEAEPPLRALFESGAGLAMTPGAPVGTFEQSFSRWPPQETAPMRLYFEPDGSLRPVPPDVMDSASSFKLDPDAGQRVFLADGGNVWDLLPKYDYRPLSEGHAVAFLSAPLSDDLLMMGTGSADLWVQSSAADADLQVSITEVRPDGQEMYVQSGWLRSSQRALDKDATPLYPDHTHLQADAAPLPAGQWTQVRVVIAGFGHVFRAGSQIRVSVDTPGGARAVWRFQLKQFPGEVTHMIAHSAMFPSSVLLPVLSGVKVPVSNLPACPSLRGQPCRTYVPLTNTPAM